jgi:hypothetical protein
MQHIYVLAYGEREIEKGRRAYRIESLHFLSLFCFPEKPKARAESIRDREREREEKRELFEITKGSLKVK